MDEIDSPHVGAYFDAGNVLLYGYPDQWIRILGSRIKKVHVKDFKSEYREWLRFLQPFQGDVPWAKVRSALERSVMIAYHGRGRRLQGTSRGRFKAYRGVLLRTVFLDDKPEGNGVPAGRKGRRRLAPEPHRCGARVREPVHGHGFRDGIHADPTVPDTVLGLHPPLWA